MNPLRSLLQIFLLFLYLTSCTSQKSAISHRSVVVVNDQGLSSEEFAERLADRLKSYDSLYAKQKENVDRVKADIIREFISSQLLKDWAKKNSLSVTDQELEAEIQKVRSSYPDDLTFRTALSQEKLTFDVWREHLRSSLLEKRVFVTVSKEVKDPSEEELLAYYKSNRAQFSQPSRVRLRQLVVEKEDDAQRIYTKMRQGSSIEKLAKEFSVAPEGKSGGDTGWIEKGILDIFDTAFNMPIGAKSNVLKSPYGYHIFEVIGKKPSAQLNFSEVRARILETLRTSKEKLHFEQWLEAQVRAARVFRDDALIESVRVYTEK